MTRSTRNSLWLRQTAYTVIVFALVAVAFTSLEIVSSYKSERSRFQELGNELIDAFYNAAARAAFHVDRLQAESVIEGMMRFEELQYVSITTDLDTVLARRTRQFEDSSGASALAIRLFADITTYQRDLTVDRSDYVVGEQREHNDGLVIVGKFEIRADPGVIGQTFADVIKARIVYLLIEFLLLASALAYIFYRTTTRPLMDVAEQLRGLDLRDTKMVGLTNLRAHRDDELGLVIDRINDLFRRIEEQQTDLIHREKIGALGSMLAEVAHELNNPLAVVSAQAELLAETASDDRTRERAYKILNPAKRCADIVRKFLSLARQRKIEKTVLDVQSLVTESLEMLGYQLAKRNVMVKTDIAPDTPKIWGDGSQLSQVLINIVVNAQQSLSSSDLARNIHIRAYSDANSEKVTISIADNGPGIPANIRNKIFDHFFTTKPEGRGTGLGLAFCKSIIEAHGGSIAAADVEPTGAMFVIELPSTNRESEDVSILARTQKSLSNLRVLVVDDDEPLATSIAEVLTQYGHSPTTAFSAEQAIVRLERSEFDVILADVHMPETDGMEFYRRAISMDKALTEKFVFVTGDALDPRLIDFFEEQHRPYINKPFELQELVAIVENVLYKPKESASVK